MNATVEVVSFQLVAGASVAQVQQANTVVNAWLAQRSGFVSRLLWSTEDGVWQDVVHWRSMEEAKVTAEEFMRDMGESDYLRLIDMGSVKMSHSPLHVQTQAH